MGIMDTSDNIVQARGSERTILTLTTHSRNGQARTVSVTEKVVVKTFLIGAALVLVFGIASDEISKWARKKDAEELRPQMELLASDGKEPAELWLLKHFFDDHKRHLPELAERGNAEAQFMLAFLKAGREMSSEESKQWIRKAADQGYEPALRYLARHQ